MAAKKQRENKIGGTDDSADILRVKNFAEMALFCTVSEINAFLCFRRNSRWPPKKVAK